MEDIIGRPAGLLCFPEGSRCRHKYGITLQKLAAAGISAMMHGYLAFDQEGTLLVPFRTWRNTMHRPCRGEALRGAWTSICPCAGLSAHLYQAVLNGEEHMWKLAHVTTLDGLCPLEAHRPEGAGRGRRLRRVPHRQSKPPITTPAAHGQV